MSSSFVRIAALGGIACLGGSAAAQLPGAPVLQNAWAAPGIVIAGNFAGGSGSAWAGAAAWAPASGRFQLSAGAGMQSPKGGSSRGVYGARAAFPLMQGMGGKLGFAGFAGIGGGASKTGDTTSSKTVVPAGIAIGYRQPVGTGGGGFSVYADPSYQYHSGANGTASFFRVGFGIDAGINSRFGITAGLESGSKAKAGRVGPAGTTYGIGLSMKLGR